MKTLFSKHKWMRIIYGALLLAAGIIIIVISSVQPNTISTWLSIISAITLFTYAAALLFTGIFSLKEHLFDLAFIYAAIFTAIGVVLLANTNLLSSFIVIFVATILCAAGLIEVGSALAMIFFNRSKFFMVVYFLMAIAFITLGVIAFCFPEQAKQVIYYGLGISLIISSLIELTVGIYLMRRQLKTNTKKKEREKKVIDADVVTKKEETIDNSDA